MDWSRVCSRDNDHSSLGQGKRRLQYQVDLHIQRAPLRSWECHLWSFTQYDGINHCPRNRWYWRLWHALWLFDIHCCFDYHEGETHVYVRYSCIMGHRKCARPSSMSPSNLSCSICAYRGAGWWRFCNEQCHLAMGALKGFSLLSCLIFC